VEKIVKKLKGGKVEVKWKGYDDTTIEPVSGVKDTEAYQEFAGRK